MPCCKWREPGGSSLRGTRSCIQLGCAQANCFSLWNMPTDGAGVFKLWGRLSLEDVSVGKRGMRVCCCVWEPRRAEQETKPRSLHHCTALKWTSAFSAVEKRDVLYVPYAVTGTITRPPTAAQQRPLCVLLLCGLNARCRLIYLLLLAFSCK